MHVFRRRHILVAGFAFAAVTAVRPAFADANPAVARAIGWLIGDNLSLGALNYGQGASDANVAVYFAASAPISA